ncbi:probable protein S-acyltransferase 12 [Zingiber officinale]|uniref:probable protein S-acyltransferase 12 n=1 Tax=Zingiber officinale TaxID=94328 RepID=UPI001C4AD5DE|nr:probable protein S-acyltransferase 12 [Zingiber officinale]
MDCACVVINPFRLCSALRVLGSFMVLLFLAIVALSYYAVVVVAWGPRLFHSFPLPLLASAIIVIFHLLLALLIWSYFMVVFRDPGAVPANWRPFLDEESPERTASAMLADFVAPETRASASSSLEGFERRPNINYCARCQNGKPPRCHHCSVCQRCVLKMDHHCVWVVNCVGAHNYKFFLLFLLYTFLETVLDTFVLLPSFINFFGDARRHSSSPGNLAVTFLAFVLNLAFALSLLCFVVMHTSLVLSNTTTIEVYEKKKAVAWKYDIGKRNNFEQVFGAKKLFWFLPLFSAEDLEKIPALQGLDFPTRSDVEP